MEDHYDAVIIGAGISGIATAKTFIHEYKFRTLVIEKYDTVGGAIWKSCSLHRPNHFNAAGLWQFRKKEYGCMSFTHINVCESPITHKSELCCTDIAGGVQVSKENYSFSDFPFPEGTPDFPHHKQVHCLPFNNFTNTVSAMRSQ